LPWGYGTRDVRADPRALNRKRSFADGRMIGDPGYARPAAD
jgi:hypothetical protein